MSAAIAKLYIDQGATLAQTVSLRDGSGNPYNLTGYTIAGEIRSTATSSIVITPLTISITAPATLGQFVIALAASATAILPVDTNTGPVNVPTIYTYDVNITTGVTVIRVLQGEVIISPEVTR